MMKIGLLRKLIQTFLFILLVYGGYFATSEWKEAESLLPKIAVPKGAPSTSRFAKGEILWASDEVPLIDTYPPSAVCRFSPRGGLFKACFFHFISENFTWATHAKYLLPHIAFYVLLAFLVGRLWCGWMCPLGFLGDIVSGIRRHLRLGYRKFTPELYNALRKFKYLLLFFTLLMSALIAIPSLKSIQCDFFLPYCQLCPGRLIFPLFGGEAPMWGDFYNATRCIFTLLSWIFLLLFLLAFFYGRRIWCQVCPIGAFTSFFNRGATLELHKDNLKCNGCGICAECCPVGSTYVYEEKRRQVVNHADCIFCLRCLELCPRDKCLTLKFFGKKLTQSVFKKVAAGFSLRRK